MSGNHLSSRQPGRTHKLQFIIYAPTLTAKRESALNQFKKSIRVLSTDVKIERPLGMRVFLRKKPVLVKLSLV